MLTAETQTCILVSAVISKNNALVMTWTALRLACPQLSLKNGHGNTMIYII